MLCRQRFYWVAPRRGRGARAARYGRAWRKEPLLRLGAGSQGRRVLDEMLGAAAPAAAVDDRRPERVADARPTRGRAWASAWSPGSRSRAAIAGVWSSSAADVAPIDVHLVCRPTLKRTRAVARFLDGLAEEARRAAALPAIV